MPKRTAPVVTTTDLLPMVDRDQAAEAAAGVSVTKLAARLVNDGTGEGHDLSLHMDLVIDALDESDISDLSLVVALFDQDDVLLDKREDPLDWQSSFERAHSRDGRRLHIKFRGHHKSANWSSPLSRCQLTVRRPAPDAPLWEPDPTPTWEPEQTPLEVEFVVEPRVMVEVELDRALVRSGYNDGYVVSVHARVEQLGASRLDDLERLLARKSLPLAVTFDGFLHDADGRLVDTFSEHVEAGRTMPFVLHVRHLVGLDIPLACRAVVSVRRSDDPRA